MLFPVFLFFVVLFITISATIYFKKITNSFLFSVPLWVMTFWLFKGGVDLSISKIQGITLRYESELFPIHIGFTYNVSLMIYFIYYLAFIMVVMLYLFRSSNINNSNLKCMMPYGFPNLPFFLICMFFVFVYAYYARKMFMEAFSYGITTYEYSRFMVGTEKPFISLSSWIAVSFSIIGFLFSNTKVTKALYFILLIVVFGSSIPLGNRHILLSGLILIVLLNSDGIRLNLKNYLKYLFMFSGILLSISLIYFLREQSDINTGSFNFELLIKSVDNLTSSSEFIYSHMSMYGVLDKNIPISFGHSLVFLITAFFPKFTGIIREGDIYEYYINHVTSNPYKGFSIANPTGWYLNFGMFGVVFGGAIYSTTICILHRLSFSKTQGYVFYLMLIFFVADSIGFMRTGGPESFRSVFLIKSIIPCLLLLLALSLSKVSCSRKNKIGM